MTTIVTVKTLDYPVKVTLIDLQVDGKQKDVPARAAEIVEPNSEKVFHITNLRSLAIDEQPYPAEK
jgi:hypothetical protein